MINKKNSSLLSILLFLFFANAKIISAQEIQTKDTSINAILHPELNFIQFYNRSSLANIASKWANSNTITIAHMGDSHVQTDVLTGELRRNLQSIKGDGGRGMTFPYSIAKTYSANDYKSTYTGKWKCANGIEYAPKLHLGPSGFTCQTSDPNASFTLIFKTPLTETNKTIKIFCKKTESSYDFILKSSGTKTLVMVDHLVCPNQPYVEVELPIIGDTITIQLTKQSAKETEFEFYGMSLESSQKEGVSVHCLGVGGARYGSILAQKLFQEQFPFLNPDLVIIDFGTNDYIYSDEIPSNLETEIKNVIKKVRFSALNADILLTTTQDMYRKGINVRSGEAFSDLIRKIAKDENCAFYDWFWVAGGPRTMATWLAKGLAQNDMIHLRADGYKLKGQLLTKAFLKTISILQTSPTTDSLIFPLDSLKKIAQAGDTIKPELPKHVYPSYSSKTITHIVKSGETLGGIARKYHTTVATIMSLNGMKNTTIKIGRTLKIKANKR